jgi:5'-3' exoribonuclease 2
VTWSAKFLRSSKLYYITRHRFELGLPASPYEQLLAVFPKQSAHAIPVCYRSLLSDPKSEIIDFYPTNFHIDINGARFAWMGVALLPFIDRERLINAMKKADRDGEALSEHEREMNQAGTVYVFFHSNEKRSGLV